MYEVKSPQPGLFSLCVRFAEATLYTLVPGGDLTIEHKVDGSEKIGLAIGLVFASLGVLVLVCQL